MTKVLLLPNYCSFVRAVSYFKVNMYRHSIYLLYDGHHFQLYIL